MNVVVNVISMAMFISSGELYLVSVHAWSHAQAVQVWARLHFVAHMQGTSEKY